MSPKKPPRDCDLFHFSPWCLRAAPVTPLDPVQWAKTTISGDSDLIVGWTTHVCRKPLRLGPLDIEADTNRSSTRRRTFCCTRPWQRRCVYYIRPQPSFCESDRADYITRKSRPKIHAVVSQFGSDSVGDASRTRGSSPVLTQKHIGPFSRQHLYLHPLHVLAHSITAATNINGLALT